MEDKVKKMSEKVGSIQGLFQESEKARKQTSRIRTLFAIGVILIVVAYILGMWIDTKKRFE